MLQPYIESATTLSDMKIQLKLGKALNSCTNDDELNKLTK